MKNMLLLICITSICATAAGQTSDPLWKRIVLDEKFYSEGATFADINADGTTDIISGPFWYEGPEYRERHQYTRSGPFPIGVYSNHFFSFAGDFNADGHPDVLAVPMPGTPAHWYENPGTGEGIWEKHMALDDVSNESPAFTDITGDKRPELVCIRKGAYGYAAPDPNAPTEEWTFVPVTENRGWGRFTHGMGVGDVNGDGRPDLLEKDGWWEQTAIPGALFRFHKFPFAAAGGSQMYAYDFDGDGDNDVVSVQSAHGWGLKWFEQRGADGDVGFIPHQILPDQFVPAAPLNISQMHSLALKDMDGDGIQDLVTGKRFYAHGGHDPGAHQLPVLYWFRTTRSGDGVTFEPHLIHERVGSGTQLTITDLTGNGRPDILVANKLGTTLMQGLASGPAKAPLTSVLKRIGSPEYAEVVRTSDALSPADEAKTFVLPAGFEAQLVVAEPDIAKPMNMAFDHRGRLWISSSQEYPIPAEEGQGRDSIVVLEDTDGDGHRETITTFADDLNIPMGLYPYQDGVICFSIPNIWFLRDTDGDGRSDRREKLYGPMGFERDTHGMCNAFTRGFDGWLYACHGFNNHTTVAGADGHEITMQSGNTFRMKLDGSRIEHYTHGLVNPFGMSQTVSGDLLVADCHTKPITLLLPGGYYDSFGKPHDGLGYVPNVMTHLHGSTAIGGIAQYNASVFPDVYHGDTFGGNVMTGRVNRNSLHQIGASYRAVEEPDLLISGDPWFRPMDLTVGPDGALYVADFYNRIIGHYEVKLDHPGRDRHRGRVWRIAYIGDSERRDAGSVPEADRTPDGHTVLKTDLAALASANQTVRMLATDRLTDAKGDDVTALLTAAARDPQATVRAHVLWILQRRGALSDQTLVRGLSDASDLVRVHSFRVLESRSGELPDQAQLLKRGFEDPAGGVRRAAVHAAAQHNHTLLVTPLLKLYENTPPADAHLRHAVRMTLRDHLREAGAFRMVADGVQPNNLKMFAGLCLSLNTAEAGDFLVRNIKSLADVERSEFSEYVRFAVRHVRPETVGEMTEVARQKFQDDKDFQLELLRAARDGLRQGGAPMPEAVRRWGLDLSAELLGLREGRLPEETGQKISWKYVPYPGAEDRGSPFVVTKVRKCDDGMEKAPLISSFPKGESWTGIYRSDTFSVNEEFQFFMCGHDGFPQEKAKGLNHVRLRDAASHDIIKSWNTPRNDLARKYVWTPDATPDRQYYLEVIDGDSANAYAWLAVGRFSVEGLNPKGKTDSLQKGLQLIGSLQLSELKPVVVQLLERNTADRASEGLAATTLSQLSPGSLNLAAAAAVSVAGTTVSQRAELKAALIQGLKDPEKVLGGAMQVATAPEQLRIAQSLCSDAVGAGILIGLVEKGQASPELLRRSVISDPITAFGDDALVKRRASLVRGLPDPDVAVEELIAVRKSDFLQHSGTASKGEALFVKNCAVCHQIGGKGKKVGPNLDGIGTRGMDRLTEDILAPSRNVDIAFRSTTVVLNSGKVASGLSKGIDGARLILFDNKGEEISIPTADIDEQVVSRRSPMPDNVSQILTEEQYRDLMAWLLSQRR